MAAARTEPIEISNAVQDYAKAIWSLAQRSDAPVSTSALADRLHVSPASASAMVKRLESLGLASREPYHGVQLTRAGERDARPSDSSRFTIAEADAGDTCSRSASAEVETGASLR